MTQCTQCGEKPAIFPIGGHNKLCIDCYYKLHQISVEERKLSMAEQNFLLDEIDMISGVRISPRYEIPFTPVIHQGPTTFNNFDIDNSMVAAINGTTMTSLNISITQFKNAGQSELADEIKKLTEEVIKNAEIEKNNKNEILDQLSYLVEQVNTPTEKRNKTVIKIILEKLPAALSVASSLITIWDKLSPILNKFLQI